MNVNGALKFRCVFCFVDALIWLCSRSHCITHLALLNAKHWSRSRWMVSSIRWTSLTSVALVSTPSIDSPCIIITIAWRLLSGAHSSSFSLPLSIAISFYRTLSLWICSVYIVLLYRFCYDCRYSLKRTQKTTSMRPKTMVEMMKVFESFI